MIETKYSEKQEIMTDHERMDKLIENARPKLHAMLDAALNSGALSEEEKDANNYVLAKTVITIWGKQEHFAPMMHNLMQRNLEHII